MLSDPLAPYTIPMFSGRNRLAQCFVLAVIILGISIALAVVTAQASPTCAQRGCKTEPIFAGWTQEGLSDSADYADAFACYSGYYIDYGDGSVTDTQPIPALNTQHSNVTFPVPTHKFANPGEYTLTLNLVSNGVFSSKCAGSFRPGHVTVSLLPTHKNRAPVAKPDNYKVFPGSTVEGDVLANDHDPDGDPFTTHVISISFAHREYSGLETHGYFLYVAGPGTNRELFKTITYVAIDSHGAKSKPTTVVVKIQQPKLGGSPFRVHASSRNLRTVSSRGNSASASAIVKTGPGGYVNSQWLYRSNTWVRYCTNDSVHAGIHTACYTLVSKQNAIDLSKIDNWHFSFSQALQVCLKYGLMPMKNRACAKSLLKSGVNGYDSAVDHTTLTAAVNAGGCYLTRWGRHRTLAHPLAGVWDTKPSSSTLYSTVLPFRSYGYNASESGWGTWSHGSIGRWRIPVFCDANGHVWTNSQLGITEAPSQTNSY